MEHKFNHTKDKSTEESLPRVLPELAVVLTVLVVPVVLAVLAVLAVLVVLVVLVVLDVPVVLTE